MERAMTDAVIAQKGPFAVDVEAGKDYCWCACGRSAKQPFCDGSHKATTYTPVHYKASETKTVYFCGCKNTLNAPICDGTHSAL